MTALRAGRPGGAARRWRAVLLGYCLFVVYGSFYPFDLSTDPRVIQHGLDKAVVRPFAADGRRRFSIPDVVSNVALGGPVGLLLVHGGLVGRALIVRVAGVAVIEAAFASAIEVGQVFAPGRTVSAVDVLAQVAGAVLGALAWHLGARTLPPSLRRQAVRSAFRHPAAVVALAVAAVLVADALYPYAVTLDVSTAWGNLRRAQIVPLSSIGRRFWPDLVVEKILAYAALAAAARLAFAGMRIPGRAIAAWVLATGLGMTLEVAKLGIVGRAPAVDNVLLAGAGAGLGLVAAPCLRHPWARRHAAALASLAAVALLVYEELTPFDFVFAAGMVRQRLGRIEWLPMGAYYGAETHSALFDLGKKLVLGGFVGVALTAGGWRRPWLVALALGALLEALQLLQRSHVPALTDVLSIAAGAALGRALHVRYRAGAVSEAGH